MMMMMKTVAFLIALIACSSDAFQAKVPVKRPPIKGSKSATTTTTSLEMTVLSYNGKKKDFKSGSSLKSAVAALGVKPKYSCTKGDCGSCTLSVGGQRLRPCIGKVPPEPKLKSLIEKGLEIK